MEWHFCGNKLTNPFWLPKVDWRWEHETPAQIPNSAEETPCFPDINLWRISPRWVGADLFLADFKECGVHVWVVVKCDLARCALNETSHHITYYTGLPNILSLSTCHLITYLHLRMSLRYRLDLRCIYRDLTYTTILRRVCVRVCVWMHACAWESVCVRIHVSWQRRGCLRCK